MYAGNAGSRRVNREEQCYGIPNLECFPRAAGGYCLLDRDAPHRLSKRARLEDEGWPAPAV
jgi:hypothetical protein